MVSKPPLADESPDTLKLLEAPESSWFSPDNRPDDPVERLPRLPVGPGVTKVVHARLRTAHAVIAIKPGSGELRIPYVRRKEQGDFKRIMDAIVTETGIDRIRFTNVFTSDDAADEAYDRLDAYFQRLGIPTTDRDDDVRLEDAVHGFDRDVEDWGAGGPADVLVGRWEP